MTTSTVTSKEIGATAAPARKPSIPLWPVGIAAFAFGIPFWIVGAMYTLDGWVIGCNVLVDMVRLPVDIPAPAGWWRLLLIPVGLLYSWVEVMARPGWPTWATWRRWLVLSAVWAAIILSDVWSTFAGVRQVDTGDWPLAVWVAGQAWIAGGWALFLTFVPEGLMLGGWGLLRR